LLSAAQAAAAWMEDGIVEQPTAAQALAAAALLLRRAGALRVIPLVVWAAYPLLGLGDPDALPWLRGEVARRLTGHDSATWAVSFLAMAAEAARAGLRELDRLQAAATAGAALTTRDPRARLDDALAAVLRHPALTPAMLAQRLGITPQAASRLLARLAAAGIVTEITGRKSFRAFAIMATRSVPESSRE
jgi:DNA-binding transcriptional ArsR family regulator